MAVTFLETNYIARVLKSTSSLQISRLNTKWTMCIVPYLVIGPSPRMTCPQWHFERHNLFFLEKICFIWVSAPAVANESTHGVGRGGRLAMSPERTRATLISKEIQALSPAWDAALHMGLLWFFSQKMFFGKLGTLLMPQHCVAPPALNPQLFCRYPKMGGLL